MLHNTIRLPVDVLVGNPLTRDSVIELAQRSYVATPCEVVIIVTDDDAPGGGVELASIELQLLVGEGWRLQYVSHPRWNQVTEGIEPLQCDIDSFLLGHLAHGHERELRPESVEAMEEEGLGPLVMLDLRRGNRYPVVPTRAQAAYLKAKNFRGAAAPSLGAVEVV